ncbi:hypothetical protein AMTR_s00021p00248540 [Amborella trichopoda]|uniref:Uncharacterized protein n=1 Tax=Amborella trichopoda TaxID=13333 RepID=W1Q0T6_AMBTC|nr:hypothetical protein AMTR_s00021p00248540 [Amborella trichopoda]
MKRRHYLHGSKKERLSRPAEGERSNKGELDDATLAQTKGHGDPDEMSSATIVAQKATLLVTAGQRKGVAEKTKLISSKFAYYRSANAGSSTRQQLLADESVKLRRLEESEELADDDAQLESQDDDRDRFA